MYFKYQKDFIRRLAALGCKTESVQKKYTLRTSGKVALKTKTVQLDTFSW
jgi:hypothetical protein